MITRNGRLPNVLAGHRQVAERAGDRDEAEDRDDAAERAADEQQQDSAPIA